MKGQFKNALIALEKAVELRPSDPLAHHHLGNTYYMLEHYAEAVASFKKSLYYDDFND